MSKHNVTLYIPVRVKVHNLEAESCQGAIKAAEDYVSPVIEEFLTLDGESGADDGCTPRVAHAEPDESTVAYLVDHHDDPEYSLTEAFEPDLLAGGDPVSLSEGSQFDRLVELARRVSTLEAGSGQAVSEVAAQARALVGENDGASQACSSGAA